MSDGVKLLDQLRERGMVSLKVRHEEKINLGNYENICPSVELGIVMDTEDSAEETLGMLRQALRILFQEEALEELRGLINRRNATQVPEDQKLISTAQHFKTQLNSGK